MAATVACRGPIFSRQPEPDPWDVHSAHRRPGRRGATSVKMRAALYIRGPILDHSGRMGAEGKGFDPTSPLYRRVDEVLDRIRPYVRMDGGQVELVNVNEAEGTVYIRFEGSCRGCPSSDMTLHMGIESQIRAAIPEIKQVVAV